MKGLTMKKIIYFFLIALILSGCAAPTPTAAPTAAVAPTATTAPVQPTSASSGDLNLSLAGAAQSWTVEVVPAVPADPNAMWWGPMPAYRLITLQGYPVSENDRLAQIYIYPATDLIEYNETAGKAAADLQPVLTAKKLVDPLPFLPLINAKQVMQARPQFLDFKNGTGVSFLTQYNQAPVMINNKQLIYTYQGLTSDGKYYIAAVLPVTHPELPANEQVLSQDPNALSNYPSYAKNTSAWLNQLPADSFTPDLKKLDALVQSIEVK
jgi:hypothetical protein